jgi:hypothetical protein
MQTLSQTEHVIDALGGTGKVADLTGRSPQAVSNWRARPTFPPETFLILTEALKAKGMSAPRALWRMSPEATGNNSRTEAA